MTYSYDAEGERVQKTGGPSAMLYWYGAPGVMAESDLAGNMQHEYIFFNGRRVARVDTPGNSVHYYLSDHLNSTSMVVSSAGTIEEESDYSPFGTEYVITGPGANHYKFTGKERDSESGLDDFGARFYASKLARWMSPDWSAAPEPVPYAKMGNPQSLNLYSFVTNNPLSNTDLDGHARHQIGGMSADYKCSMGMTTSCQDAIDQQQQSQSQAQNQAQVAGQGSVQHQNANVAKANHYLSGSKEMRLVEKAFKSGHFHIVIIHDGNDRYDPTTRTVYWDPHSALQTTEGGHQTPALGLGHEMAHATGNRHDTAALGNIPDARYDTKEERRVILNYENPAARELGESTRSNHGGVPYNVTCPTCQ